MHKRRRINSEACKRAVFKPKSNLYKSPTNTPVKSRKPNLYDSYSINNFCSPIKDFGSHNKSLSYFKTVDENDETLINQQAAKIREQEIKLALVDDKIKNMI